MAEPKQVFTTMVLNNAIVQSMTTSVTVEDGSATIAKVTVIDRDKNWRVDPKDTFVACLGADCQTIDWPELFLDVDPETYFALAGYKTLLESAMGGGKRRNKSFCF